ncbi:hypothetical protein bthur0013_8820 [Bacillus thuringiensis IBL 200]|nr:hypothetical protein bthur0013_8820 [Bacillus thuringiensis IBL 200]
MKAKESMLSYCVMKKKHFKVPSFDWNHLNCIASLSYKKKDIN